MRGRFLWRQRGPLSWHRSEVNGKCFVEHILSGSSVVLGCGGDDHFIRGIFHSAGYVSSHASHQLQGLCERDDCICSSVVGQKHETSLSSSPIIAVECSLRAPRTPLLIQVARSLLPEKCHCCLLLFATFIFMGRLCATVQYVLLVVICYLRQVAVLWLRHRACLTAVVLGTRCQEHYAVLFCCANSSLCRVCPWCPKIHEEWLYTHTHAHKLPQRTQSTLCNFWGCAPKSVFIYSCCSTRRSWLSDSGVRWKHLFCQMKLFSPHSWMRLNMIEWPFEITKRPQVTAVR